MDREREITRDVKEQMAIILSRTTTLQTKVSEYHKELERVRTCCFDDVYLQ